MHWFGVAAEIKTQPQSLIGQATSHPEITLLESEACATALMNFGSCRRQRSGVLRKQRDYTFSAPRFGRRARRLRPELPI